jgi:hypothetical protein
MKSKLSKRLVIDASIAQASGGKDAVHPTSKNCRDFLNNALEICHRFVFNKEILTEWKNHESDFAKEWRAEIVSKGKDILLNSGGHEKLKNKIIRENININFSKNDKKAILKDFILIEAAIETDKIIVSLDIAAETICNNLNHIVQLQTIKWLKPERDVFPIIYDYEPKKYSTNKSTHS